MKKTRSLCIVFGLAGSIVLPCPAAQTSPTQAGQTLGLPRLKQARPTGSLAALKKDKVTIDALAVADDPGVRSTNQQGVSYVTIDAGKSLTRTIRGGASDVTFVTFFAYASIGTSIEVGGAQMRVGASPRSGHVQFILGSASNPRTAGHELADTVRLEQHGSLSLAPLPVLTVRLDPAAGTWDIFMFDRLLTAGLPLDAANRDKKFTVNAGTSGAWLLGLVSSDDNPLCEDTNSNGVDDAFERQKLGTQLEPNTLGSARTELVASYLKKQRATPMRSWTVRRIVPAK